MSVCVCVSMNCLRFIWTELVNVKSKLVDRCGQRPCALSLSLFLSLHECCQHLQVYAVS